MRVGFPTVLSMVLGLGTLGVTSDLWAQAEQVERERAEYRSWLEHAPNSPLAALAQRRLESRVVLGPPESDIPLPGLRAHTLEEGRLVRLTMPGGGGRRPVPRNRLLPLGPYRIFLSGARGRTVVTVYDSTPTPKTLSFYPYDPNLVFTARLVPPKKPGTVRVLAVDGVEAEATEAGTFRVPLGPKGVDLRVRRIPDAGTEESELEIYFRDETNDEGTYPAGRFVSLQPLRDGRYVLDFNRARSPFCAYSSVYPCPIPWSGNAIQAAVTAGERYEGGGLEVPKPDAP